ncbi:MAG: hypothetical protein JNM12_10015 [Alphaproteobacteria bacterium]|nr:hypothetical protein [Alphaproteobacteria bacterium]
MTKKDKELPVPREAIGDRWSALLRSRYPERNAAKSIARDFDCETRTAKAWLAGQRPQLDGFSRAAQLFGISAVIGVLWPDSEEHHRSKLHDDLQELRSRLDRMSRELGGSPNDPNDPHKNGKDRG